MVYKKANQRLYFIRKLKNVHVDTVIMTMFYRSIVESVLSFCISCWYGNATLSDRKKLNKIVKCAQRLGCIDIKNVNVIYENAVASKLCKIMKNESHPLNTCFKLLPSQRRISSIYSRTARFNSSFVLNAIRQFNGDVFM